MDWIGLDWIGNTCIIYYMYHAPLRWAMSFESPSQEFPTSWLKMADENETAPKTEKEVGIEEDHGHCSDCENEEHHFDDG